LGDARRFKSLREALKTAITEQRPDGKAAYLLTSSGMALKPDELQEIWSKLQGS
jgi:hypothetical protein